MGRLIEALNKAEQAKLKSDTLQTDSAKDLRLADARADSDRFKIAPVEVTQLSENSAPRRESGSDFDLPSLTLEQAAEPSYKKYPGDVPAGAEPETIHGRQPSQSEPQRDELRRHTDRPPERTLELIPIHSDQPNNKKNLWLLCLLFLVILVSGLIWYSVSISVTSSSYPDFASTSLSDRRLLSDQPQSTGAIRVANPEPGETEQSSLATASQPLDQTAANLTGERDMATPEQSVPEPPTATTRSHSGNTAAANAITTIGHIAAGTRDTRPAMDSAEFPSAAKKPVFQITRSSSVPGASLSRAQDQQVAGQLSAAKREYQALLRSQPANLDALMGLAQLQFQLGNIEDTQRLYATLLQLDPKNPVALLGLVQSSYSQDLGAQESALQSLIEQYPTRPSISFALGNFYSSQARWSEAQVEYANALDRASANTESAISPDYAFNLGIAHEQLGQPEQALAAYREAQQLAAYSSAGFDLNSLDMRLQSLGTGF